MASKASPDIVTPLARIVMGNLYRPRTQDGQGRPLVYKTGAKMNQPRSDYFFAAAIPKGQEVNAGYGHMGWAMTPWGQEIFKAGCAFMAHAPQLPSFAWKIGDGDSTVPNTKGRRLIDSEGCRGHWILFFSGAMQPKLCNADGSQILTEIDAIKPGYYVQVGFNAKGNDSNEKPGVYLNPLAVAMQYHGPIINTGVDVASLGFGQGMQMPAGASLQPIGQLQPQNIPGTPPILGMQQPPTTGMMQQYAPQPQMQQPPQMQAPQQQYTPPPMQQAPQMQQPSMGMIAPQMQQPMGGAMPGAQTAVAPGAGYGSPQMGVAGYAPGAMTSPSNPPMGMVAPPPMGMVAPPPMGMVAPPPMGMVAPPPMQAPQMGMMQPPPGVQPNAGFLQPQQQAPMHQMTAAAQGTYEAYRQAGYTDEVLRAQGLML